MIARIGTAITGFFGGSRSWWLLVAVAAVGAGLYAWGAVGRADRDAALAWSETVCAAAGSELNPAKGKRGAACAVAIRDLAAFKRDATASTAELLAQAMRDQAQKRTADLATSDASARAARAAAIMMEKANAEIGPDDRVGRDWFDALNRTGGLRAPR